MPDAAPAGERTAMRFSMAVRAVGRANMQSQASPSPTVIVLQLPEPGVLGLPHASGHNSSSSLLSSSGTATPMDHPWVAPCLRLFLPAVMTV